MLRIVPVALVLALVGCVPDAAYAVARDKLGTSLKHTHIADDGTFGADHVYVFCRAEHSRDVGSPLPWQRARTFDGHCVTVVCAGDICS